MRQADGIGAGSSGAGSPDTNATRTKGARADAGGTEGVRAGHAGGRAGVAPSASQALGRYGEDLAAEHLTAAGLTVLSRNWRCARGELDLVVRDVDGTLVFVEVKTRAGTGFGTPAEAIGPVKARRLRLLAGLWLIEHRPPPAPALRFDVIGIVRRRGEAARLTHLRGAF